MALAYIRHNRVRIRVCAHCRCNNKLDYLMWWHNIRLYAPVGKCTRNSWLSDYMHKLRFGHSYSKHYSRYDPPHIGAYRRRDNRLCRRICSHCRWTVRIARSRGTEKGLSSNRIARIDRPCPCWIRVCRCIRNASSWGDRCIVRSSRTRNCRCIRLKCKKAKRTANVNCFASCEL